MYEHVNDNNSFEDLKIGPTTYLDIDKDFFELRPSPSDECYCKVTIDELGIISIQVKTTKQDGTRHPYFEKNRATEILLRAISYIAQSNVIKGVQFDWGKPATDSAGDSSDNYSAYLSTRDALLQSGVPVDEAKKKATESTWTFNRIASPLGFRVLREVTEKGDPTNPDSVQGVWVL